ncbi:unnamed protein product [Symbiodinium natans]|uniref:Uncharacterized protein n=1 Tax=Symbiodinium natans TaxID=878477 RepID=A0A812N7N9_9DINO|nr:unnamed protein product [Symbiodinium natans]
MQLECQHVDSQLLPRLPWEASPTDDFLSAEVLLGRWVDSQGHSIHVLSTDAFDVRLLAKMKKKMSPDKHLALKPIRLGGGWQCGHSILDSSWSTSAQLHWVAGDGHVTVWVRPQAKTRKDKLQDVDDQSHHTSSGSCSPLHLEAQADKPVP